MRLGTKMNVSKRVQFGFEKSFNKYQLMQLTFSCTFLILWILIPVFNHVNLCFPFKVIPHGYAKKEITKPNLSKLNLTTNFRVLLLRWFITQINQKVWRLGWYMHTGLEERRTTLSWGRGTHDIRYGEERTFRNLHCKKRQTFLNLTKVYYNHTKMYSNLFRVTHEP